MSERVSISYFVELTLNGGECWANVSGELRSLQKARRWKNKEIASLKEDGYEDSEFGIRIIEREVSEKEVK